MLIADVYCLFIGARASALFISAEVIIKMIGNIIRLYLPITWGKTIKTKLKSLERFNASAPRLTIGTSFRINVLFYLCLRRMYALLPFRSLCCAVFFLHRQHFHWADGMIAVRQTQRGRHAFNEMPFTDFPNSFSKNEQRALFTRPNGWNHRLS